MANKSASKGEMYVATETGEAELPDGSLVRFTKGVTRVREGHPVLDTLPTFFKPMEAHYGEVEDATAEPGRKRGEG